MSELEEQPNDAQAIEPRRLALGLVQATNPNTANSGWAETMEGKKHFGNTTHNIAATMVLKARKAAPKLPREQTHLTRKIQHRLFCKSGRMVNSVQLAFPFRRQCVFRAKTKKTSWGQDPRVGHT